MVQDPVVLSRIGGCPVASLPSSHATMDDDIGISLQRGFDNKVVEKSVARSPTGALGWFRRVVLVKIEEGLRRLDLRGFFCAFGSRFLR